MPGHDHSTTAKPLNAPAMNLGQVGGNPNQRLHLVAPTRRGALIRYIEDDDGWFVQFFEDGKHLHHMDYATDDGLDALRCARYWINQLK